MIRKSYVVPRLVLLGLLWLFFAFALDPLLKWGLENAGSAALGARVVHLGKAVTDPAGRLVGHGGPPLHELQATCPVCSRLLPSCQPLQHAIALHHTWSDLTAATKY